ncbi:hypothetical protein NIES2135_54090 [Leptolyngbya boryana NIES-2135]|jgi:hypothetical protein|uniref:Uncharacterized protein n=1 Tax=Leptolyngbya boryana NIES-2135 TaxID=1973484 RepID=A0A1Z4JP88_LEPBY|nr:MULTISPECIES: hypothetical protein [Leptolyngbya]BAY58536.1 hypothetical protein NIES2135_54090 [Leptolyngbya boryana NIES-2135]MBD2370784.1 hypothetical protein [Leptolyngbya sp. FACHB-161]MBD2377063.1 hypothetical protein [Leptolyngbya sp. FACHB-238]MBD2401506.1 hypothetical protein [Leptolyngbya sp. FACHB-239]MBD2408058.1 hypothetical protein [Leptolyngbya sp. FACHB-402]
MLNPKILPIALAAFSIFASAPALAQAAQPAKVTADCNVSRDGTIAVCVRKVNGEIVRVRAIENGKERIIYQRGTKPAKSKPVLFKPIGAPKGN